MFHSPVNNIYLLIFLPLFSSILCQIIQIRKFSFAICVASLLYLLALLYNLTPDVLKYDFLANDFNISLFSLGTEFKFDLINLFFLSLILIIQIFILLFYNRDICSILDQRNHSFFYSVFLINIFGLNGILTSNNLLNIYIYLEIYYFSFYTIATISRNNSLLQIVFKNFCSNAIASILIIISFLLIYLIFGKLNLDEIASLIPIFPKNKFWITSLIFLILNFSFLIKFFPIWQYFKKIKTSGAVSSFLVANSLFTHSLIGIFLSLKLIYLFFGKYLLFSDINFDLIIIILGVALILFSSFKLIFQKHLKLIAVYLSTINLGYIAIAIVIHNSESLQAMFFFLINLCLINFFIFLLASFMKKNYHTSSIKMIGIINDESMIISFPIKLTLLFILCLPLTIIFNAYWYMAYSSFNYGYELLILLVMFFSYSSQIKISADIIKSFYSNKVISNDYSKLKLNHYQIFIFWLIAILVYCALCFSKFINELSLKFASILLLYNFN